MNNVKDLTAGKPIRLITAFALPLVLANILQQLYQVIDTIIVGQGVGVDALSAVGASDWLGWMFLWAVQGFTQGCGVSIARAFGAGDKGGVKKAIGAAVFLSALLAIVLTVLSLSVYKPVLRLLQTPVNIIEDSYKYLGVTLCGLPVIVTYNLCAVILRSLGDGRNPFAAMAVATLVNIGLDLLFVMVFKWGVTGAAAATVIAQGMAFLYCLIVIVKMNYLKCGEGNFAPVKRDCLKMTLSGLQLAVQNAIIAVGGMALQFVINGYGLVFVAGFTATNKLYGILECVALSLGLAMTTYMSQNAGAKNIARIKSGLKCAVFIAVAVSVTISLAMIFFGKYCLMMFISSKDPLVFSAVLEIAYKYLFIMSCCLAMLYLLHVYRASLQGLNNMFVPMLSGIVEFAIRVSAALALPLLIGQNGIFLAEIAAWTGACLLLIPAYYFTQNRIKKKFGNESAAFNSPFNQK